MKSRNVSVGKDDNLSRGSYFSPRQTSQSFSTDSHFSMICSSMLLVGTLTVRVGIKSDA